MTEMKSIRDWIFAQLVTGSFVLPRPLSGSTNCLEEEVYNQQSDSSGATQSVSTVASHAHVDASPSSNNSQEGQIGQHSREVPVEDPFPGHDSTDQKKDSLSKIEALQINFFRVLGRLGQSPEDILVAKVLYRIHLATLIKAGESELKRININSDKARAVAAKQEAAGYPVLDFSLRILVLGKTGVGKSATVNSLFNQKKTLTNAFHPATKRIQEVTGSINGVKLTVIDTPGFLPSSAGNARRNRKIMISIKRYIQRSPPDVVLYLERLDTMSKGYNDYPLLKLVTDVFGSAIWFNTILVMTHASAALPEGPNGFPIVYESYVSHCTDLLQHYVKMAVSDAKIENPAVLAENHMNCRTNVRGEKILPNGLVWRQQLLLLCVCTKVLGDANALLGLQQSIELGASGNAQVLSIPHLFSSFLQQQSVLTPDGVDELDELTLSDDEEDDEYDQLPPIRILTKKQFEKLSDTQKRNYLDELDYRETLFLKKQLKEEFRKRSERKLSEEKNLLEGNADDQEAFPDAVPLPDMAIPPSFDSDSPVHRYRAVVTSDQWLWRPVLDPHGWDHDVGFDGVNMETAAEIKRNLIASISGQMSKDKHNFSIHSECAAAYTDPRGPTYSVGLEIQSRDRDLIYTMRSHAKTRNMKRNLTGCGISVTSFQNKYYIGTKLEDTLLIGKRLKLVMNAGGMGGGQHPAYGGSLGATILGRDYPVRNDKVSVTTSVLSSNKEVVIGGSVESEFRPCRGLRLSVNANLNNRKMGKLSIKTASSEHVEIAFIALITIFRAFCRKREPGSLLTEAQDAG